MTTVEVLREARALIAAGWTRGRMHRKISDRDHYCALGAIVAAVPDPATLSDARSALYSVIPEDRSVAFWNDAQSSKRPVLAAFDRAIAAEGVYGKGTEMGDAEQTLVDLNALPHVLPWVICWARGDHIYPTCPAANRSEGGFEIVDSGPGLAPDGGDVCGWCRRLWHQRGCPSQPFEPCIKWRSVTG